LSADANFKGENRRDMMLNAPIYRIIPQMAIPTVISMLITTFYSLADTYFVSSLGTAATAAVGINFSLDNLIMTAGSFLAVGANSYIARLLGAKDDKKASQVLSTSVFSALITGTAAMILGLIFLDPLVRALGATPDVVQYAKDYAGYVLLAAPFMATNFVMNQCLRSEGSSVYSMVGIVSGAVLNIGLDPLFIFTFGWGVKGASAATAISKFVSFIILITPYVRRSSLLHLSTRNIKFSSDIVGEVVKMGFPAMMRTGLAALSTIVLNNMAAAFSASVLAAMAVVNIDFRCCRHLCFEPDPGNICKRSHAALYRSGCRDDGDRYIVHPPSVPGHADTRLGRHYQHVLRRSWQG
jgi:putative MATE family efflux protein